MHASSVTVLGKNVELRISSRSFMNKGIIGDLAKTGKERRGWMDGMEKCYIISEPSR